MTRPRSSGRPGIGRGGAVALALGLLASCNGGNDAVRPATPLAEEQVLTIAYSDDTYQIGEDDRPDLGKWPLNARIFDTLVNMDEQLQVEPMLAERWEYDPAANSYRFHLRRGVMFHDGSEFGAADVKDTFDRISATNLRNSQRLGPDSVTIVDAHTVDITPEVENRRLVEQLAHPSQGINKAGSDALRPVGTGPFRFVDYQQEDRLVVERFDDHWGERARAERITFRFVPDAQTRLLGLRSGELDIIADVLPDATDEVESAPGLKLARSGPAAYGRIDINIAGEEPHEIGADPLVREALAHAVDRRVLVETVYGDNASADPLPPTLYGSFALQAEGVAHDPERARELLGQAGWVPGADGVRIKGDRRLSLLFLTLSPTPDARLIGEVLQTQLQDVGIEVQIDSGADPAITSSRRENGEYDLLHQGGSQNDANPCFLLDLLYSSPAAGGRESNRFLAPGGPVDDAIARCRAAPTLDEARQWAAEAAHLLIDVDQIYIPAGNAFRIWAMKQEVEGFVAHPGLGRASFAETFLASP